MLSGSAYLFTCHTGGEVGLVGVFPVRLLASHAWENALVCVFSTGDDSWTFFSDVMHCGCGKCVAFLFLAQPFRCIRR